MTDDQDDIPMATNDNPHAEPPTMLDAIPPLVIGESFAMAEGLDLVDIPADGRHPGTVAVVTCLGGENTPCGQTFMIPLLQAGAKTCPRCSKRYAHVLIIAEDDDDEIIAEAMAQVLRANGFPVPDDELEDDDEGDDDQADEHDHG